MAVLRVKDNDGNIIDIPAIKGDKGDPYTLTEADKEAIVEAVLDDLPEGGTGSGITIIDDGEGNVTIK